jgi:hypothetical protein
MAAVSGFFFCGSDWVDRMNEWMLWLIGDVSGD